jgi:hypothetical protein
VAHFRVVGNVGRQLALAKPESGDRSVVADPQIDVLQPVAAEVRIKEQASADHPGRVAVRIARGPALVGETRGPVADAAPGRPGTLVDRGDDHPDL